MAAQTQSLRTNAVNARIDRSTSNPMYRVCKQSEETIDHIVSGWSKFARKSTEDEWLCSACAVLGLMSKVWGTNHGKIVRASAECLVEKDYVKILWDFYIQTDNEIHAKLPDLLIQDKANKICYIIDVAIPGNWRVLQEKLRIFRSIVSWGEKCKTL